MNLFSHSDRATHRARVTSAHEVAPAHYHLRLHAPALALLAQPGQFVHVLTTPNADEWVYAPLLRRAFSVMTADAQNGTCDVLFRVEGRGTKALSGARVGDVLDLIGPLGQPFDLSPFGFWKNQKGEETSLFHVKQNAPGAIVVGGGVGVPPLVYLSQFLSNHGIAVRAVIGARSQEEIIGLNELVAVCHAVSVTTDDGSRGHHGRVTDVLPACIERSVTQAAEAVVYACGPWPMLRAVAALCERQQVRCQVSLEENMPCGIGVCNGCVVRANTPLARTRETSPTHDGQETMGDEWSPYRGYRRVCVEGPACWADEINWEGN